MEELNNNDRFSDIQKILIEDAIQVTNDYFERVEEILKLIMLERFGVIPGDMEDLKKVIEKKRLTLIFRHSTGIFDEFIGVCANNRWIYTLDRVIGKTCKRWNI